MGMENPLSVEMPAKPCPRGHTRFYVSKTGTRRCCECQRQTDQWASKPILLRGRFLLPVTYWEGPPGVHWFALEEEIRDRVLPLGGAARVASRRETG